MSVSIFDREFNTVDNTGPLAVLATGGVDVPPGAEVALVAASPGRVKVAVSHAGATGRVWVGLGQTAQVGVGAEFLDAGGYFTEFYAGAVRVLNAGVDLVRVTWTEYGA